MLRSCCPLLPAIPELPAQLSQPLDSLDDRTVAKCWIICMFFISNDSLQWYIISVITPGKRSSLSWEQDVARALFKARKQRKLEKHQIFLRLKQPSLSSLAASASTSQQLGRSLYYPASRVIKSGLHQAPAGKNSSQSCTTLVPESELNLTGHQTQTEHKPNLRHDHIISFIHAWNCVQ